jgi:tetratricopeptide (TPR) repeat protein
LLNENNKTNEGIEVLKGIALKVENPKNVYVNIANLYSLNANGDYSISIKYFEKAYELDKTDKVLCNHIAKLYQFSGNTQQANEYLSKCK